jgi:hypothetical protein
MNTLKTIFSAAVAPDWDDFGWMQDGIKDAFTGILSTYGIDTGVPIILSGCEVTLNVPSLEISSTAGYISLDGEVLKVDAHTLSYTEEGGMISWRVVETDDPSGAEQDSNGNTVQCYQKRRAQLVQPGSAPEVPYYEVKTLVEVMRESMKVDDLSLSAWHLQEYRSYISGSGLTVGSSDLRYIILGNTMIMDVDIHIVVSTGISIKIDIKGATGYDIAVDSHSMLLLYLSGVMYPLSADGKSSGTDEDKVVVVGNDSGSVWSGARIRGQLILQVTK